MLRTLIHLVGAGTLTATMFGGIPAAFVLSPPPPAVEIAVALPEETEAVFLTLPLVDEGAEASAVGVSPMPAEPTTSEVALAVPVASRVAQGPGRMTRTGSSASTSSSANPRPRRQCLTPPAGIQSTGGNSYQVKQRLFDSYTSSLDQILELGRATPHQTAAGVVGYRLVRVRCGSPLHAAGMRRGDVVHSINGMPVRSIPQALLAYSKLRSARNFTIRITRKGAPMTLRYRLV